MGETRKWRRESDSQITLQPLCCKGFGFSGFQSTPRNTPSMKALPPQTGAHDTGKPPTKIFLHPLTLGSGPVFFQSGKLKPCPRDQAEHDTPPSHNSRWCKERGVRGLEHIAARLFTTPTPGGDHAPYYQPENTGRVEHLTNDRTSSAYCGKPKRERGSARRMQ